jgi:hypothetical protein
MTQENLILHCASSKNGVTISELYMFGVASPSKVVSRLRRKGMCIYTNRSNSGTIYKIGVPTARMIAMAFSVAGPRAYM